MNIRDILRDFTRKFFQKARTARIKLRRTYILHNPLLSMARKAPAITTRIFDRFARENRDVFFIQIGAHDGVKGDHLHRYTRQCGWRGLLVEPVPWIFEELKKNKIGLPGLKFENAAIDLNNGERIFYSLDPSSKDTPFTNNVFPDMLGSFYLEHILKNSKDVPDIEKYVVPIKINCLTFASLLVKHGIHSFDVLMIDTEGHDCEILKQIDVALYRPKMIVYESIGLPRDDVEFVENKLRAIGYKIQPIWHNTIALLETAPSPAK